MNEKKLLQYTHLINAIGTVAILTGVYMQYRNGNWLEFLFFVVLSAIAESMIIPLGDNSYVSIGFAIGMAAILLFDPFIAAVVLTLGTMLKIYSEDGELKHIFNTSFYKRYFNGSAYAISALAGGVAGKFFTQIAPTPSFIDLSVFGILGTFCGYVFFNLIIYSKLFSILQERRFWVVVQEQLWCLHNFAAIAPIGILMLFSYKTYGWFFASLIFGPLLLARYSFSMYIEMKKMYFETIRTLSNALDAKDEYTNGHSHRVAEYSVKIAEQLNLSPKEIETVKTAALLHDIGKIGIKDEVLNKPGKLDFKEFYEVQQHPEIGANIIKDVAALQRVSVIIRYHHERFDGNGYPDSINGDQLPIESAIIAVADAYDAMTSDQSYRKAMSHEAAVEIIRSASGSQFHPEVVDVFLDLNISQTTEALYAG
ncbi:HD-GYP domain-containing protein [Fusibacter sp. JL216-2]|uniref:HD-GYP domain-containing protein n=1 Tax=Fusibacter sp. JL216-2 TaxID=3071453 RepID=UPI003D32C23A